MNEMTIQITFAIVIYLYYSLIHRPILLALGLTGQDSSGRPIGMLTLPAFGIGALIVSLLIAPALKYVVRQAWRAGPNAFCRWPSFQEVIEALALALTTFLLPYAVAFLFLDAIIQARAVILSMIGRNAYLLAALLVISIAVIETTSPYRAGTRIVILMSYLWLTYWSAILFVGMPIV